MKFTGPLTRRRREAVALAAREQINAATARMQRNVYRDHALRMADAIQDMKDQWADPHGTQADVQDAINEAMGLALMAKGYDQLQAAADPTIQGN